jgi:hypothetical protein
MAEDEINLKSLRSRFLGQYKDEYLNHIYEIVYDKYQEELLLKFDPFYKELLECLQPEKREEIEKNLFEFDFMNNLCNYLNLSFLIYKLSFEQKVFENEEPIAVALVFYNTEEEKIEKVQELEEFSKQNELDFLIIYLDMDLVRSLIDSFMLQPKTIIGMTQSKTDFLSEHYENKLRSLQNSMVELKKDAEHGKKFKGKPLSSENEIMYQDILEIQEELLNEFGPGHRSSLSNSVRVYSKRKKLFWVDSKIKSTAETVRILREGGRI